MNSVWVDIEDSEDALLWIRDQNGLALLPEYDVLQGIRRIQALKREGRKTIEFILSNTELTNQEKIYFKLKYAIKTPKRNDGF